VIPTDTDPDYLFNDYAPYFPEVNWEPLTEQKVDERALHADPDKKALFGAASKVTDLTPAIGTVVSGIDLRNLTSQQKDELALLVAERGVVVFHDQAMNIEEQLELGRHFGPLHKHATTAMPKQSGLEEVHVVYTDGKRRPDVAAFSKFELWHSDVTYEVQPPGVTSLKVIVSPPVGGDTHWSSGYALYSSLSPGMQKYLEGLSALHSAIPQAEGSRAAGTHVRREPIETIHPVVRVHPATGWKSIFVNPGFTKHIIGIPKAESDAILHFLFKQIGENPDFQARIRWKRNSIAFWDNRIVTHSATFDFYPHRRHALRVTPHGERPLSVEEYERATGKKGRDRQYVIWEKLGLNITAESDMTELEKRKKVYND
jgi:sulfonate dioxygenase